MTPYTPQQIKKAAQALSERYRKGETPYLRNPEDRHAYLITRLPATQAALRRVLEELAGTEIESYLDIGAGPGASWDPMVERWPMVKRATMVELDMEFVKIGKLELQGKPVTWKMESALKWSEEGLYDLVLFSYSWGEINTKAALHAAWNACKQFLVIVEPGTPRGYEMMLKARDEVISLGGFAYAPCPHSKGCPWKGTKEWCHFGVRLERSREHQVMKEGRLGYEDEKFSYIILSKTKPAPFYGRMVKDSLRRKGHTLLALCTDKGIEVKTVSKKQKELFKTINKLKWGDKIIDSIE